MNRLTFLLFTAALIRAQPALMPVPLVTTIKPGQLVIGAGFSIIASTERMRAVGARYLDRLSRQTGVFFANQGTGPALTLSPRASSPEYPQLGEDESYQLDVSAGGATLSANTETGILRGLETFAQSIEPCPQGWCVSALHIEDAPRFPWRGLMIDASRHWMPVEVIERNLDAMAAVKLNVFHWHLSDDQGFRAESKIFPRLQELGSDGHFYTQAQIREVVGYARDRGIRVVPEFDMPGHTTAWFVGYPQLAAAPGPYAIERHWGIFQPTMDPTKEETYTFIAQLLAEMSALFPDPYFHIGGDEVDDTQWKNSPAIQSFARRMGLQTSADLQTYFNSRIQALLRRNGKTMIGWDEVLHPGLAAGTVVQSWRGQASLAEAARQGYRGVLSFGYYLDHLQPASFHYANDPLSGPAAGLSAVETSRILGGEACIWTEYVSPETIDSRIWPRTAGIAERLWSAEARLDPSTLYDRLSRVSAWLVTTGVRHRSASTALLDRIAGDAYVQPLRVLADAVEALGIEGRRDARSYSSLVPLNRLVDAAQPESETVRQLKLAAERTKLGAQTPADLAALRAAFSEWSANPVQLEAEVRDNPLAADALPASQALARAGAIGLAALDFICKHQPAPENWISRQRQTLDESAKEVAEIRLAAFEPVRILLESPVATRNKAVNQLKPQTFSVVTNLPVTP